MSNEKSKYFIDLKKLFSLFKYVAGYTGIIVCLALVVALYFDCDNLEMAYSDESEN